MSLCPCGTHAGPSRAPCPSSIPTVSSPCIPTSILVQQRSQCKAWPGTSWSTHQQGFLPQDPQNPSICIASPAGCRGSAQSCRANEKWTHIWYRLSREEHWEGRKCRFPAAQRKGEECLWQSRGPGCPLPPPSQGCTGTRSCLLLCWH